MHRDNSHNSSPAGYGYGREFLHSPERRQASCPHGCDHICLRTSSRVLGRTDAHLELASVQERQVYLRHLRSMA